MVNVPLSYTSVTWWIGRLANRASMILRCKQMLVSLFTKSVDTLNYVKSLPTGINVTPIFHRARRGAKLSMVSHVLDVLTAPKADCCEAGHPSNAAQRTPQSIKTVSAPPLTFRQNVWVKVQSVFFAMTTNHGEIITQENG